jgi:hypothetical protein
LENWRWQARRLAALFAQAMDENTSICPLGIEDLKRLMFEDRELSFKILKLVGLRLMRLEKTGTTRVL